MMARLSVWTLAAVGLATVWAFRAPAEEPAKGKPVAQAGPTAEEALKQQATAEEMMTRHQGVVPVFGVMQLKVPNTVKSAGLAVSKDWMPAW